MTVADGTSGRSRKPPGWQLLAGLVLACGCVPSSSEPAKPALSQADTTLSDGAGVLSDAPTGGLDADAWAIADQETSPDTADVQQGSLEDNTVSCDWTPYEISADAWFAATGCEPGYHATPKGCQNCAGLAESLPAAISEVLGSTDDCADDSDCVEIANPMPMCGFGCPLQLAADATAAGAKAYASLAGSWCAQEPYTYNGDCPHACKQGKLQCVGGQCRKVGVCDPLVAGPGAACDDGNACTQLDACAAPGSCKGQAVNCDDANPCTADSCDTQTGCLNKPVIGACPSDVACGVAASCKAGMCVDSGLKGWSKQVHGPELVASAKLAPLPAGGYAIALRGTADLIKIKRFSAKGVLQWQVSAGPPKANLSAIVGVDGDQILVAGVHYPPPNTAGEAFLLRLAGNGTSLGWAPLPLGKVYALSLTRVATGLLVTAALPLPDNKWHAAVALLDMTGGVVWQTDLGLAANYGEGTFAAWGPSGYGILAASPGAKNSNGEQADLRFVHLDANGIKQADVVWPTQDNDYGTGIAGLAPGGFLLAANAMVLGPTGQKTAEGHLRVVSDAGQVLGTTASQTSFPTGFAVGPGGTALLSASGGPTGDFTLVQPLGAASTPEPGWQIPAWPAGSNVRPAVLEADGSAVFLRGVSATNTLMLHRFWPSCSGAGCAIPTCN